MCDRGQAWPEGSLPRRAGVSSFGITGTNVHIIVEEPPERSLPESPARTGERAVLLPISARATGALTALAAPYRDLLRTAPLQQVAAAAGVRRSRHDQRLAIVAATPEEAAAKLDAFTRGDLQEGIHLGEADETRTHRTAWVFPGQGAQWAGMGRDLLEREPNFAAAIAACEEAMRPYVPWSLTGELTAGPGVSRFAEIDVIQPTIFAVQVALAALWRSWGCEADAVIGHSMGEVAAAHVAGVLDLDDAARIICGRSRLVKSASGRGAMAAVELPAGQAEALIAERGGCAVVAVHNAPSSCVLAGEPGEIDDILRDLEAEGIFGRRVQVDIASHSPHMDPLREPLLELLSPLRPRQGDVPLCSTVTGRFVTGSDMDAAYWADNLRLPVLFSEVVQRLADDGFDTFVEFSPNPLLARAVQQNLRHTGRDGVVVTTLARDLPGGTTMIEAAAELYVNGREIDFSRLQPYGRHEIALPSYPWQRGRHWKEPSRANRAKQPQEGHPIIGMALALAPGDDLVWSFTVDTERLPYLDHHRVHQMPMLSGTTYHELALATGEEAYGGLGFVVEELRLERALFLTPGTSHRLQVRLGAAEADGIRRWECYSTDDEAAQWSRIAIAILRACSTPEGQAALPSLRDYPETVDATQHYAALRRRGIEQTGPFRSVVALHRTDGAVAARLRADDAIAADLHRYLCHPALFDSALQPVMTLLTDHQNAHDTYVPVRTGRCRVHARPASGSTLWSTAVRTSPSDEQDTIEFDVLLSDDQDRLLVSVEGFQIQRLAAELPEVVEHRARRLLYGVEWSALEPLAAPEPDPAPWLVIADSPLGPELCADLYARGSAPTLIQPGSTYRRLGVGHYRLDLALEDDWKRLIKDLAAEEAWPPKAVVRMSGLDDCYDVLPLVKALTENSQNAPRLWLVTIAAQAPDGTGDVDPAQSAVWGLGRVVPYEHPELRCSLIDLPASVDPATFDALLAELTSDGPETEIALRDGRRYAARLRHRQLPQARPVPVRPDGTYVIAGGYGGVGLLTAEWLVRRGARHVVLVGRNGPPGSSVNRIAAMRAEGAEIHLATADISSRQQVADLLEDVAHRLPPLRGIVNSAVILDDATLSQLNRQRFLTPMPPKVDGSRHLHELTRRFPLDFFLLFSSAASVIGSPGQGNYSAANGFLDGLAWHRRAHGLPALSINWGQWADTGQVAKADKDLHLDERGFAGFTPAEGLAILDRLLGDPPAQACVMSFDATAWTRHFPAVGASSLLRDLAREASQVRTATVELTGPMLAGLACEEAEWRLSDYLCSQIAAIVQLPPDKVEATQLPHRLGLDSLMAVQLRNRITADLGINLPIAVLLQRRTIAGLAAVLAEAASG
ncbi:type I polyketide synthase [Nonomuraea sp. NPDC050202]|uniref:type I polyketide synthase n=1 Tax=Nonomuraea sp. NPDC050202 TaxID=3155035 RepID=UPI0033FB9C58